MSEHTTMGWGRRRHEVDAGSFAGTVETTIDFAAKRAQLIGDPRFVGVREA
jgi:hypothetical protein